MAAPPSLPHGFFAPLTGKGKGKILRAGGTSLYRAVSSAAVSAATVAHVCLETTVSLNKGGVVDVAGLTASVTARDGETGPVSGFIHQCGFEVDGVALDPPQEMWRHYLDRVWSVTETWRNH